LSAIAGEKNVVEYSFVENNLTKAPFFSVPVSFLIFKIFFYRFIIVIYFIIFVIIFVLFFVIFLYLFYYLFL
jgi:hypothetical protein